MIDDSFDEETVSRPIGNEERVSLQEALNSLCHLCNYKLEWDASVVYDALNDINELVISSKCCGKKFFIKPIMVETVIE